MRQRVTIREVGPRDGLQMVSVMVPADKKIEWCRRSVELGIRDIEVTSFVPPKVVPQFADAKEVAMAAMDIEGLEVTVLVPNLRGAQTALELGVPKVHYTLSSSETHNMKNVRRSIDESIEDFRRVHELRASMGASTSKLAIGLSAAFGCTMEGVIPESRVLRIASKLLEAGAEELTIADTVGVANPRQVAALLKAVQAEAGNVPVAAHFHDTRGLGLANVVAALDVGITEFDTCLAGLGGCPFAPNATGNINTEDTVYLLESMGLDTGVDLEGLLALRETVVGWLPGEKFSGAIAKAGLPSFFQQSISA